jgi:hypothetical protein
MPARRRKSRAPQRLSAIGRDRERPSREGGSRSGLQTKARNLAVVLKYPESPGRPVREPALVTRGSHDLTRRSHDVTRRFHDVTRGFQDATRRFAYGTGGLVTVTRRSGDLTGGLRCETRGSRTVTRGFRYGTRGSGDVTRGSNRFRRAGPRRRHVPGPVHRLSKNLSDGLLATGRKVRSLCDGVKKGRVTPLIELFWGVFLPWLSTSGISARVRPRWTEMSQDDAL